MSDWPLVRLGDVITVDAPLVDPTKAEFADLPHVSGENIESGTGRLLNVKSAREDGMRSGKYLFDANTVLYSKLRPYLRKAAIASFRGLCSADMYPLRIRNDGLRLDQEYLWWFLLSPAFTKYADGESRRARMPKLNREQLFAYPFRLPPLPEQKRIAEKLSAAMSELAIARTAAEERIDVARRLPAALLRTTFDGAAQQDGAYERKALDAVCELLPAHSISKDGDADVRAVTTACLTEAGFSAAGVKSARMRRGHVAEATLTPGEVLIARSNTPELVGRVSLYTGEPAGVVASDLLIRLRPGPELDPAFVAAFLSFLYLDGYWRNHAGGASGSMKKITRTQLRQVPVPVPPLARQHELLRELSEKLRTVQLLTVAAERQAAEVNAVPAMILAETFGDHRGDALHH